MRRLELVLPCYDEGPGLRELIDRVIAAARTAGFSSADFRLIVVENGSRDDSRQILSQLRADPARAAWFDVIELNVNQGYGAGLWAGLRTTRSAIVAWSHSDLQCDPTDVFIAAKLVSQTKSPALVKGWRLRRDAKDSFVTRVFETLAGLVLGLDWREINAQPKVFHRDVLTAVDFSPPPTFAFDLYVLYRMKKMGYSCATIPVLFPPRTHGFSKWSAKFRGRWKTILGMIAFMFELAKREGRL